MTIKDTIRAKAPYRISFGGGGTDMPPYCIDYGGCVISTAIDRFVHLSIQSRDDKKIIVNSLNFDEVSSFDIGDNDYSTKFELFKGVVNVLEVSDGFNITTAADLPPGSGMGGSSSLIVAIL